MPCLLRYGADGSINLEEANGVSLAQCGMPRQPPLEDVQAEVLQALTKPLDYPPLAQSMLATDHVVLALEHAVPQVAEIVSATVEYLLDAGIQANQISVLWTKEDADSGLPDPRGLLPEEIKGQVKLLTHAPDKSDSLAYLAATDEGNPVLLNRAIVDADVVLPIGSFGNRRSAEYHGIHAAVYPTFSDHKTRMRFRSSHLLNPRSSRKKALVKQCNDVGWLLGVNFTIQVVPGSGEDVLHVVAGDVGAVRRRGRELYDAAWSCSVRQRASLVVAAIEGGAAQQTWANVGHALAAAIHLVEDGGAIAVCCDLAAEPGPAVRQLADSSSRQEALRLIEKQRPEDALTAAQLADAVDRAEVYLLSRLDEELLEQLDIAAINDPEQVTRLIQRHPSCILLSNASHAVVRAEEG